jgi:hypothetical protein
MNDLIGALWAVSGYLPAIVLYLAGIAIAIYRWRLHPEVSAFAAVGCALHLIGALFWSGYVVLQQLDAAAANAMTASIATYSMISRLLSLLGTGLLLAAVFGWRYRVEPGK